MADLAGLPAEATKFLGNRHAVEAEARKFLEVPGVERVSLVNLLGGRKKDLVDERIDLSVTGMAKERIDGSIVRFS